MSEGGFEPRNTQNTRKEKSGEYLAAKNAKDAKN